MEKDNRATYWKQYCLSLSFYLYLHTVYIKEHNNIKSINIKQLKL